MLDRHRAAGITPGCDRSPGRRADYRRLRRAQHSSVEDAVRAVKAAQATMFVVGIGGTAGISIKGERALRALAEQTGGRPFFPTGRKRCPTSTT